MPLVERAVKLKPQDAQAQSILGMLYAKAKEKDKALEGAQTALALAPDDPGVLSNVADIYELLGDRRNAIAYLEKALQKGFTLEQAKTDPDMRSLLQDSRFHPGKS